MLELSETRREKSWQTQFKSLPKGVAAGCRKANCQSTLYNGILLINQQSTALQ
jgi:hypothetical protein